MTNELKNAVEVVAMVGGHVQQVSDIYGMWRQDRVTVVIQYETKAERSAAWERCQTARLALREAGFKTSTKQNVRHLAGTRHMGVPLHYVYSFDVMV